ncbi:unnamed protein product [Arctogadus glacialis]
MLYSYQQADPLVIKNAETHRHTYSDPTDAQQLAAADEVAPPSTSRDAPPAAVPLEGPGPGPGPMATRPATGKELLPLSWQQTLPEEQQQEGVGRALFRRDPQQREGGPRHTPSP